MSKEYICKNCKFYSADIYNPVGYENSKNKPESEGPCTRLTGGGSIGIITDPDLEKRGLWVTSNFGCVLFKKAKNRY